MHGVEQQRRIVADAILEHGFDFLDIRDLPRRVAVDHDQVGILTWLDRTDLQVEPEVDCAVERADPDRLDGEKPALTSNSIARWSRNRAVRAGAGRVRPRHQQAAGGDERALQREILPTSARRSLFAPLNG